MKSAKTSDTQEHYCNQSHTQMLLKPVGGGRKKNLAQPNTKTVLQPVTHKNAVKTKTKTLLNQSHAKNATTKHKNCAATSYTKNNTILHFMQHVWGMSRKSLWHAEPILLQVIERNVNNNFKFLQLEWNVTKL
jgi:hypothetical protein